MTLSPGTRLGPYEITAAIGAGGMGEVYYIEGVRWLAANQHIDGLYLDDIAFSRETVKRLAAVRHESRPEVVIDLHSANQFNVRDGFINSAMLYMEHFPYITRLWFGEYFDYDQGPDYWMTDVAAIPFGVMGEMLQDGGHPYRGLVYGMTARKYGNVDPRPVWAMMNEFGIADSRMMGYWLDEVPVHTDNADVLATAYVREDGVLIVLGSWSDEDEVVEVTLDLVGLEIEGPVRAWAPAVEGLQSEAEVDLGAVPVPAGQGLFLRFESVSAGDVDARHRATDGRLLSSEGRSQRRPRSLPATTHRAHGAVPRARAALRTLRAGVRRALRAETRPASPRSPTGTPPPAWAAT